MDQSPHLGPALLPRVILSWVRVAGRGTYTGEIPGIIGSNLSFCKSEAGFSGSIGINDQNYTFRDVGTSHLAASIAVSLGVDQAIGDIRDMDLARLGKSVDLLVKANAVRQMRGEAGGKPIHGQTAKPIKPDPQIEPALTQEAAPTEEKPELPAGTVSAAKPATPIRPIKSPRVGLPGVPRRSLKVTKSQAATLCELCEIPQFMGAEFVGCQCFRPLAKSVTVTETDGGYNIRLAADWDRESVLSLMESLGYLNAEE